jgi:hypothetical protein
MFQCKAAEIETQMTDRILAMPEPLGPEWLAHRFDESSRAFRFILCGREERASVPFLTDDYLPPRKWRSLSQSDVQAFRQRVPLHFIFHSGFCCSTLLAKCFDVPGLASSFSEPLVLNDIVGWRLRGAPVDGVAGALTDALRLLGRAFPGDSAAIVKPSNILNALAMAMVAMQPSAQAVVMHAPLEDFLISIAKKGLDGRRWARTLFVKLRVQGCVQSLGFSDTDFFEHTDLQIAAMAWLAQQNLFGALIASHPGRVRSLNSSIFMAGAERTVREVAMHFNLFLSDAQFASIAGGALARDSKSGRRFDAADRAAEYEQMRSIYGSEIEKVAAWTREVAAARDIAISLPAAITL